MAVSPAAPPRRSPWFWVPSLYFTEGIPYVVVMVVSVIMYKRLGISNTEIALYTSWLYLPWVIKPFWSPLVDVWRTKRFWTVIMQALLGAGFAGVALTLPTEPFFQYTLAFLWLLAFSSATHDIAADGFYMLALSEREQAWFVGIRSTFYRMAMITGQGLLIILAGFLESTTGLPPVEVPVQAGTVEVAAPPPTAVDDGTLRLVPSTPVLTLALERRAPAEVQAVLDSARAANLAAGLVAAPHAGATPDASDTPGWWTRFVVRPLEGLLRGWFGPQTTAALPVAGNVAVLHLRLSGPLPDGETAVVNLRVKGDRSIQIVEGARLAFSAANAQTAAQVVVQLDPKLDTPTTATLEARSGNLPLAWSLTFFLLTGLFVLMALWHHAVLPRPPSDRPAVAGAGGTDLVQYLGFLACFIPTLLAVLLPMLVAGFLRPRWTGPWGALFARLPFAGTPFATSIVSFFQKPEVGLAVAYVLFYRFAEAQLVKLASPFLLDSTEAGGLALTTGEVGFVYGTVGVAALTLGGILGGVLVARGGLKKWLWPMALAINVPNVVYLFLAAARPESFWVINLCVAVEQFGYGLGFTAFMLFLIYFSDGPFKTAHYALCTGLMALGMMLPGMFSGWLQELIGYPAFFSWVLIATLPSFLVTALVRVDPTFGLKEAPAPDAGRPSSDPDAA